MQFNNVKKFRHGTILYNINDRFVGRSVGLYGEFSFGESEMFQQIVRPGDVVVEAGAHIGTHTVHLAQLAGPQGAVYAFEPQRLLFQALCANMALNSITNAFCSQKAVGREVGGILVPQLDPNLVQNFGGLAIGEASQGELVPKTTIDALSLARCRLIKIDVEGMEREVLLGARETILRHRPFLYVENDRQDRSDELIRHIDGLGYDLYWHKPPLFNPDNYLGNPENVFGALISVNMLCVPPGEPVVVQGFQRVEVPGPGASRSDGLPNQGEPGAPEPPAPAGLPVRALPTGPLRPRRRAEAGRCGS